MQIRNIDFIADLQGLPATGYIGYFGRANEDPMLASNQLVITDGEGGVLATNPLIVGLNGGWVNNTASGTEVTPYIAETEYSLKIVSPEGGVLRHYPKIVADGGAGGGGGGVDADYDTLAIAQTSSILDSGYTNIYIISELAPTGSGPVDGFFAYSDGTTGPASTGDSQKFYDVNGDGFVRNIEQRMPPRDSILTSADLTDPNAVLLALQAGENVFEYTDGFLVRWDQIDINTGAMTIDLDGLGAKDVEKIDVAGASVALESGDASGNCTAVYNLAADVFTLISTDSALYKYFPSTEIISRWGSAGAVGDALSVAPSPAGLPAITALNYEEIVSYNGTGNLATYRFDGRDWREFGTGPIILSAAADRAPLTSISQSGADERVVVLTYTTGVANYTLTAYSRTLPSGAWTSTGAALVVAGGTGDTHSISSLSGSQFVVRSSGGAVGSGFLTTYDFDGAAFSQVGNSSTPALSTSFPAIAPVNSTDVVLFDYPGTGTVEIIIYSFDGTDWIEAMATSFSEAETEAYQTCGMLNASDLFMLGRDGELHLYRIGSSSIDRLPTNVDIGTKGNQYAMFGASLGGGNIATIDRDSTSIFIVEMFNVPFNLNDIPYHLQTVSP